MFHGCFEQHLKILRFKSVKKMFGKSDQQIIEVFRKCPGTKKKVYKKFWESVKIEWRKCKTVTELMSVKVREASEIYQNFHLPQSY